MKNKGLMALAVVFAVLVGGVFLVGTAPAAQAYDDYGYGGYDDYGYDGYGYGYDDYSSGYDNYGGYDDYGYGGYDDYGYGGYDDYGYGDCYDCGYDYGYDECDYGYCGSDYGYDDYNYGDCYSDCYDDYDDCYSCNDYVPYVPPYVPPVQPVINNTNTNTNTSNNNNSNVNQNNINIRVASNDSEPERREIVRENDQLICVPASQSASVNQTVNLSVSGGDGEYRWTTPGASNVSRRGSGISLSYGTSGFKTITVESDGDIADCSVQVSGGQVLAAFAEFPNTGAGGWHTQTANMITFAVSLILGAASVAFFMLRRRVNA